MTTSCPFPGYRFLIQLIDELTEEEARARLVSIYGKNKAAKAKLVPGVEIREFPMPWGTGMKLSTGFTAYVPEGTR